MKKVLFAISPLTLSNGDFVCDIELTNEEFDSASYDFAFVFDTDAKNYFFEFETFLGFHNDSGAMKWVKFCTENLREYLDKNGYDTTMELDLYQVFTEGVNAKTTFATAAEAFAFMKFATYGFSGSGVFSIV